MYEDEKLGKRGKCIIMYMYLAANDDYSRKRVPKRR